VAPTQSAMDILFESRLLNSDSVRKWRVTNFVVNYLRFPPQFCRRDLQDLPSSHLTRANVAKRADASKQRPPHETAV